MRAVGPDLDRYRARRHLILAAGCVVWVGILAMVQRFVPAFAEDPTIPAGIGIGAVAALGLLRRVDALCQRLLEHAGGGSG